MIELRTDYATPASHPAGGPRMAGALNRPWRYPCIPKARQYRRAFVNPRSRPSAQCVRLGSDRAHRGRRPSVRSTGPAPFRSTLLSVYPPATWPRGTQWPGLEEASISGVWAPVPQPKWPGCRSKTAMAERLSRNHDVPVGAEPSGRHGRDLRTASLRCGPVGDRPASRGRQCTTSDRSGRAGQ